MFFCPKCRKQLTVQNFCAECGASLATWNTDAEQDGFQIENGILVKYFGSSPYVKIPDGVERIGSGAFALEGTHVVSAEFPDSVSVIEGEAFYKCKKLRSMRLPNRLKEIEYQAFFQCESIEEIFVPESVVEIGFRAFCGCSGLKWLTLSEGIRKIGDSAFSKCTSLREVVLPASLCDCGDMTFLGSGVTAVRILNSQTMIGFHSFSECPQLRSIVAPMGSNYVFGADVPVATV